MRHRFAVLILFAVLPAMSAFAAPAPPPSAILDIGPPLKGKTAEKYRQEEMGWLIFPQGMLHNVWRDPEVSKLASVARWEDPRPWLSENLEVTPVTGTDRLLRLRFRAGSTAEQVAILNSLLRVNLRLTREHREFLERILHMREEALTQLTAKNEQGRDYLKRLKFLEEDAADLRSKIARLKQLTVIRWAK